MGQPSPALAYSALLLSLVSFCLVISGASVPWLGFSAPNAPTLTFGLLSFCSGGNCISMTQAPYTGDLCQLKVTAALLFVAFIFSFFSFLTGAALAAGSDAVIADIKLKVVFSCAALLVTFMGAVIGCHQVYQYYVSQNNQYVALDSAPKYVLLPGFSCTIAAVVFMTLGLLVDVLTAWSSRAPVVTGSPSAPTLRSSPTHVSHYHVTSPLSLAAGRSSNMLTDQL